MTLEAIPSCPSCSPLVVTPAPCAGIEFSLVCRVEEKEQVVTTNSYRRMTICNKFKRRIAKSRNEDGFAGFSGEVVDKMKQKKKEAGLSAFWKPGESTRSRGAVLAGS